jgi:hypothetical protein
MLREKRKRINKLKQQKIKEQEIEERNRKLEEEYSEENTIPVRIDNKTVILKKKKQ